MAAKAKSLQWIDESLDSLTNAITASDSTAWMPFDLFLIHQYYSDLMVEKFVEAHEKALALGLSSKQVSKAFNGPVSLRTQLQIQLYDLKAAELAGDSKALAALNWFNEILCAKCVEDPYGFRSAKIHSPKEVAALVKSIPWERACEKNAREVGRCVNSCSELNWALYSDYFYTQWYDVFGPYDLGGGTSGSGNAGKTLLIREYNNFRPTEIWSAFARFKYGSVKIYTIYEDAQISLDLMSHLLSRDSLTQKMTGYAVNADGKWLKESDLNAVKNVVGEAAAEQYTAFSDLPFEETKSKFVWLEHYVYRNLFKLVGMDWKPNPKIFERVLGRELRDAKKVYSELTPENAREWWKKFFDPRSDFFPDECKTRNVV